MGEFVVEAAQKPFKKNQIEKNVEIISNFEFDISKWWECLPDTSDGLL
jgi:hypothetical protein